MKNFLKKIRGFLSTRFGLFFTGFAVLLLLDIVLGILLLSAWHQAQGVPEAQLDADRNSFKLLTIQTAPLHGLEGKVQQAHKDIEEFYGKRIPPNYSSIAAEIGAVAVRSNVRLSRVQYTQSPATEGLADIRMDAALSGEYTGIVKFLNGLERDKTFFVVRALALNGQQGGVVNLRLRVSTYLSAESAAASAIPTAAEGQQ
jgi:Tfp pilus assembly protein PilO